MSHKKAGNEEAARRLRTNLKDVHWYVAFVLCQFFYTHQFYFFSVLHSLQEPTAQTVYLCRIEAGENISLSRFHTGGEVL